MKVSELIDLLRKYPADMPVVYRLHSEQKLLEREDISMEDCCEARPDGWVHSARPDKKTVRYVVLPGN